MMAKRNTTSKQHFISSRIQKVKAFNPNSPGLKDANVFGLPFTIEESQIVLIPVPWEATVSYGGGTSNGPEAILEASAQVDLYHPEFPELWKCGIAMEEISKKIQDQSAKQKKSAARIIESILDGKIPYADPKLKGLQEQVNQGSKLMIDWVEAETTKHLNEGKLVGLVGGDHSTPLGFFKSLAKKYPNYGILQIDAHMDLRKAYEGFTYSHASIMYNALQLKEISKLVQVGIRDYCEEENEFANANKKRVSVFTYAAMKKSSYEGESWKDTCKKIIASLPTNVHISFDIDGLDPKLCPNTGTPVAGGFEFHEITYLLSELAKSKKKIISFDLNEVSPGKDDWDGNVGARMLFHLCGVLAKSNGLA